PRRPAGSPRAWRALRTSSPPSCRGRSTSGADAMAMSVGTGTGGGGRRRRPRRQPMAEINVTPFVDVMLVLLIIFMVAAPLLAVGVPIDLPQSSAAPLAAQNDPVNV